MVAKQRLEIGGLLKDPDDSRPYPKPVFLFTGDFTGMATTTKILVE